MLAGLSVVPAFCESSVVPGRFADGAAPMVEVGAAIGAPLAVGAVEGFGDEPPPAPLFICCCELAGGSVLGLDA